jgi:DNA repair protein SbcD/Mre11
VGFRFLHASDVHLDAPLLGLSRYPGAPVDEVRQATRCSLTNLVDVAIDEEVAFVIVAGDLFDGAGRDYHSALFVVAEASRLREAGIPLVIASGNHDAASVVSKQLRPPDNVHRFPSTRPGSHVLENVPVVLHGQGFARPETRDNLAASYPAPRPGLLNIGVLHTNIDGRLGHAGYAPCGLDDLLRTGFDYWALGHVHARAVLSEEPWVVFPGCTQGRHIRESGRKGATLVSVEDGRITAVDHRDLDVLRWALIEISATDADEDELLDRALEAVEAHAMAADSRLLAVRIVVSGQSELHRRLVAERVRMLNEFRSVVNGAGAGQVWLEQVRFETTAPIDVTRLLARDDAVGGLLRTLRSLPKDEEALLSLAEELVDLQRKLPADIADDDFDLSDASMLARLVGDLEHLLLPRLSSSGVDV